MNQKIEPWNRIPVQITQLRTDTLENPLGLDALPPRISWRMETDRKGAKQAAYQIVGRISNSLHWDSGRVESSQSTHIPYSGKLRSRDRIEWMVRVWDETGAITESAPAFFEMGLLEPSAWQADWIEGSLAGGKFTSVPCPYLRKEFHADEFVKARLYITTLGVYEASLNGQRISADLFNPGWTDYDKRIHYNVYDVTKFIKVGANALGVILGDGWYCGHLAWHGRQHYGDRPKLLVQLEITYSDGSRHTLVSDGTWKHNYGALLEADLLMGEAYDARREFTGWDQPGFDESGWSGVRIAESPGGRLVAASVNPVRAIRELSPISLTRVDDWPSNRWVFDLGQNMVGHVRLKLRGKAGQTLTIRHAEAVVENAPFNPDGSLYTIALRKAKATDHYTCKGGGEEIWEPRFTFHGFRYVEVTGCDENPPLGLVTGIIVHSDLPFTGTFECSEPLINRLQENIQWSQRGNFLSIPTDCPQRDERLGWTGDILAFMPTAAFNMDVYAFIADWLRTLCDEQRDDGAVPMIAPEINVLDNEGGPAWADALLVVPWAHYLSYGDKTLLAELYPAFEKFIMWLKANSPGHIRAVAGWQGFGDWLTTEETPKPLLGTAYFAYSVKLMSRIADVLDKKEDAANYRALYKEIRSAFIEHFILSDGLILNNAQTAYALALQFDLLPDDLRAQAAEHLAKNVRDHGNKLSTGFVGTPHLLFALSENGHLETAFHLLMQTEYPSWLYPITQGATTIWERWDGWRHDRGFQAWSMNSFNHYAYGAVGNWLYSVVAGIQPDPEAPGYKHFFLHPQVGGGLTHTRAELDTLYGKILSDWRIEKDELIWKIVIPPNTSATVTLPGAVNSAWLDAGEYEFRSKAMPN